MATSQNGWTVLRFSGDPRMRDFPWVSGKVRRGNVYTVMDYLARRFDDAVEEIHEWKSWGYAYRAIRGQSSGYSNHASATAVDFNAPDHWLGLRGTFTSAQVGEIRKILGELDGVVRWGGDYQNRADEMHFEINADAAAVRRVARKIRNGEVGDGMALTRKDKQWMRSMQEKVAREAVRDALAEAPLNTQATDRSDTAGADKFDGVGFGQGMKYLLNKEGFEGNSGEG